MKFKYTAKHYETGEEVSGEMEAENEPDVRHTILIHGYVPLTVKKIT